MIKSNVNIGQIYGSMITIDSTLTNVKQTIGEIPSAGEKKKRQLIELVDQLLQELEQAPLENKQEVDAVARLTQELVQKVKEQQPKPLIEMAIDNLTEAGAWVVDILPKVPVTISSIAAIVALL